MLLFNLILGPQEAILAVRKEFCGKFNVKQIITVKWISCTFTINLQDKAFKVVPR